MLRVDQVTLSGDGGLVRLTRGHELRTVHMFLLAKSKPPVVQTLLITDIKSVVDHAKRISDEVQPGEPAGIAIMQHIIAAAPFHAAELLPMEHRPELQQ